MTSKFDILLPLHSHPICKNISIYSAMPMESKNSFPILVSLSITRKTKFFTPHLMYITLLYMI